MKAASKELAKESSTADPVPVDPFAVDMFATEHNLGTAPPLRSLSQRGDRETLRVNQKWNSRLPRVNSNVLEASAALTRLRPETYSQIHDSVAGVLSRYSMIPADQISISLVELEEKTFNSELDERQGVFADFTLGAEAATISVELSVQFAAMLVDRMLGGDGASPAQLRSLTTAERAVIEFLYLSAVSELNMQSGEPLLRLQSVNDHAAWLGRMNRLIAGGRRGLLVSLRIGAGEITGITRVYLDRESLSALDEAARRRQAKSFSHTIDELPRYARAAPEVSLAVLIGKTDVTPQDLVNLEYGDVMLVESPALRWRGARFSGSLLLRVGDGDDAWIIAELSEDSNAATDSVTGIEQKEIPESGSLAVKVGAVSTTPPSRFAERLKMEETENVETPDGVSLIESVMVSVRVELAARRLQLDELSRLRKNQILDLGCNATDPVDLVVDGRRIALGELVDIEGRLGVRITKVLS
jgi:type III secretion system YscQ/HrcQ family protein